MATNPERRRWWALGALVLSVLTIGLDITILNVALPTVAIDLRVGTDTLQWIVNAYVLMLAGLTLVCGALGDRYGRKRLMLIGLAAFGFASLTAAWAQEPGLLIAARAVMGIGAAIIMPVTLAVLVVLFTAEERGKAISILVMGMGVGIPLGPVIGGYLLEHFWWGSIFLINVPVVVIAIIAIGFLLPESRDPAPAPLDLPGGILSTAGLVLVVFGVIEAPRRGWGDPVVLGAVAGGVALLAAFVRCELRSPNPMVDLKLFRRPPFLWGSVAAMLASFALFGLLFVVPQYLQFVVGYDAQQTGLRLLPMIVGLVIGAGLGEKVAACAGHPAAITLGLVLVAAGLALGAATQASSAYSFAATWMALAGLGTGAALSPAMDAILSVLPPERSASGTAIAMTLRQAAGAIGVAVLGSLLAELYRDRVATAGLPDEGAEAARESIAGAVAAAGRLADPGLAASAQAAYIDGMALVLIVCAGVAVTGAALVAWFMPGRAARGNRASAARREQAPV